MDADSLKVYTAWILLLQLAWAWPGANGWAQPAIERITAAHEAWVEIHGSGFAERCPSCRVVADYGDLWYALEIDHWSPTHLRVRLPDLNLGLKIGLRVQTAFGASDWFRLQLTRARVPRRDRLTAVRSSNPGLLTWDLRSYRPVGAKGEHRFALPPKSLRCGESTLLFDHAHIVFRERRFGDAQIVSTPNPGCTDCEPIVVLWYHEPTGRLDFQLQVYHRRVEGPCAERVIQPM